MNIVTLSFGASLTASAIALLIYTYDLEAYQLSFLLFLAIIGLLFFAHGTGVLQKRIINPILRKYRKKSPNIAIINDLPWSAEKRTFAWVWSEMTAEKWQTKLQEEAKKHQIKTNVELIEMNKDRVRFFIEKYNVIINPYGPVYPETNIKELPIWNTISSYVLNGGVMVSLADIPFYYAYDKTKEISYGLVKATDQFIPTEYEQVDKKLVLKSHIFQQMSTFSGTPFLSETHVQVFNTEQMQNGSMVSHTLKLKKKEPLSGIDEIKNAIVNRGFLVGRKGSGIISSNIRSIVQELEINYNYFTPLCYIDFGKGRYLTSLFFLDHHAQPNELKEVVTNLMTSLILNELKEALKCQTQKLK